MELPIFLDSSTLSKWRACRRLYFWQTIKSLSPPAKSVHLIAGGAFAAGLEAARRLAFARDRANRPTHDDLLLAAYPAFAREWGDYLPPEGTTKSFENTFQALAYYLESHPPTTDQVQPLIKSDGTPGVEFTFSIPLLEGPRHPTTGDPFLFVGRFDLLGDYNGLPCVVDEKTTSQLGFSWSHQWQLRGQFMGYCWACQQLGYPVNTAVTRGIAILMREYKVATAITQFGQHLIDRWYRIMLHDLYDLVEAYNYHKEGFEAPEQKLEQSYPFNFGDACTAYGGCAFTHLCLARDPESFMNNYVKFRWDPLAKIPEKKDDL